MVDFSLYKRSGVATVNQEVDLLLQQVDILFDTTPTEVLGDENFGTKYDTYLYDTRLSASNLKLIVETDISQLNLMGWDYDVEVHLLQGTEQDIAVIQITFYKGIESVQKTYRIS
jgi:hypothetical protein